MRFLNMFVFLFSAILLSTAGEDPYPKNYFRSPVDTRILLSGTFGELRSNHFHSGIDIKGYVGQPLYAVAEGHISRIKIQRGGYGKVIYMSHPNGYTSVYAHMDEFMPEVEAYIRSIQYRKQSYEIEVFPEAGRFRYEKGEKIGKMGVSGRSFGPHLHFEIRDTKTEKPINPLLFGIHIQDNVKPRIHLLKVYALNPDHQTLFTESYSLQSKGNGTYSIAGDTIYVGAWRVGLGVKAYDHMNGASNWNGIYDLQLFVDDGLWYDFTMETFSFFETRYLNAHLDYEEQVAKKSYINRCYRLPGNRLSIYGTKKNDGVIETSSQRAKKVGIKVLDTDGNTSELSFWLKRKDDIAPPESEVFNYLLPYDEENVIKTSDLVMRFPQHTFYEDLYLQYSATNEPDSDCYSSIHHLHDHTVPAHQYFDISIRPNAIPANSMDKAFIAYCDKDNEHLNAGGRWKNGQLAAKVRSMGDYCIMIDEQPPKIYPVSFKTDMRGFNRMTFKITDNFATTGNAKPLEYTSTVDGKWILFEYDEKNDLLIHQFDGRIGPGKHTLRLVVTDALGNQQTYERDFTR